MHLERPLLEFKGNIHYVTTELEAQKSCEQMLSNLDGVTEAVCGFDMEWPVTFESGSQSPTALIQICPDKNNCYLFHLSALNGFPVCLKRLLCATKLRKVGLGVRNDLWKLERDFEVPASYVMRTSALELSTLANQILNSAEQWNLDGLTRHLLKRSLDKSQDIRAGNWAVVPLSQQQQKYAAVDAYACFMIYQALLDKGGNNS